MDMQFLQSMAMQEEMLNLTYLVSIAMTPTNILCMMPLLVSGGLFLCMEFKKILDANPNTPVLSNGKISEYIIKGSAIDI